VPVTDLDPTLFESAMFLVPDGGTTKAYRLLARAMADEDRAGIATFVLRGKEYLCAILAEAGILRLETLRFHDEVRTPETVGLPSLTPPDPRAVTKLQAAMRRLKTSRFDPAPLTDELTERIVAHAEKKLAAGKDVVAADEDEEVVEESATDVIDLLQVLQERLAGRRARRSGERRPPARAGRRAAPSLAGLSKSELYATAKFLDIAGRSTMTRDQLADAFGKSQRSPERTGRRSSRG
jgi:DNA end-binding protein Ku